MKQVDQFRIIVVPEMLNWAGAGAAVTKNPGYRETGRVCYEVELDPAYVHVAIERWQTFTGEEAAHAETGESFAGPTATRRTA